MSKDLSFEVDPEYRMKEAGLNQAASSTTLRGILKSKKIKTKLKYLIVHVAQYREPQLQTLEVYTDEALERHLRDLSGSTNINTIKVYEVKKRLNTKITFSLEK